MDCPSRERRARTVVLYPTHFDKLVREVLMRVLFIGGTGIISTAASRLAVSRGIDLWLCNRGQHSVEIPGARHIRVDANDMEAMRRIVDGACFDSVVDWIAFEPSHVERDMALF